MKTQESMAYGIPVVTTPTGTSGMFLVDGVNALIVDTPDLFAQKVIRLLDNPTEALEVSKEIGRTFESSYSNQAVYAALDKIHEKTVFSASQFYKL